MKKSLSKPQSIATKSAFKPLIKVTSTIKKRYQMKGISFYLLVYTRLELAAGFSKFDESCECFETRIAFDR